VIVVDNCSIDETYEVIHGFLSSQNNFRGFKELHVGLSHARNRGWKEAVGEYVAFIDDDAIAHPDWLFQIKSFIERKPDVAAFGGPYDAFSVVPVPEWFPPDYGVLNLGEEERPIVIGKEWITGTNMIFKRKLFADYCGFNPGLGMSGDKVSYGEEANLLIELNNNNIPVYYVPNIKVSHLVADYKMKLTWLLFSSYKVGRCFNQTFGANRSFFSCLSCIGACVLVGTFKMFSSSEVYFKRKVYASFAPLCVELGAFVEYFSSKSVVPKT
jgi:glycosyltransferase involved in cell wall biosynthesis